MKLDSDNSSLSGARDVRPENLVCSDADYTTAELIGNKQTIKTLVAEAQFQGISPRTSTRWNEEWMAHGLVQKIRYGVYKKIA